MKHYLQVTDADFEAASKAVQNPVQSAAVLPRIAPQNEISDDAMRDRKSL